MADSLKPSSTSAAAASAAVAGPTTVSSTGVDEVGINMDTPLSGRWVLWFHKIDDDDFTQANFDQHFTRVDEFATVGDFVRTFHLIQDFTSGMFYLMREGVQPIWEDPAHSNGGFWSYRIPKAKVNSSWFEYCAAMIGNTFTRNAGDMYKITGMSLSPKINNCIIKVWINMERGDRTGPIFRDRLETALIQGGMFKKFQQQGQGSDSVAAVPTMMVGGGGGGGGGSSRRRYAT